MKKIYLFCGLLVLGMTSGVRAQDIHFSQVFETPLFLSPANTGLYNGYFRAIANYRSQWAAMNNAFKTVAVSLDGGLFKSKRRKAFLGLGLTIFNDKAGVANLQKTNVLLNVSGIVKLSKKSVMSVGLNGGVDASNANYNKLTYGSQFDGNTINIDKVTGESVVFRQFTTTDIGIGMAYEYSSVKSDNDHDDVMGFKVSFGAFHLNKPIQDFGAGSNYRLPVRIAAAATGRIDFEDTKFSLTPAMVYQKQGVAQEFLLGSYIKYRTRVGTKVTGQKTENGIGFGIFYRTKDAFVYKLLYEMGDYAIGVSFDQNTSGYRTVSKYYGGLEVCLRYNILGGSLFESRREFK